MTKKEITIAGKQYPVEFTMQTMMNFESITKGKSFFKSNFDTIEDRIAIIAAAVFTADEHSDITVEAIIGNKDFSAVQQIIAAFNVVSEVMEPFFKIPEIEKANNPEPPAEEKTDDEGAKN
jgi:hypothetical protein